MCFKNLLIIIAIQSIIVGLIVIPVMEFYNVPNPVQYTILVFIGICFGILSNDEDLFTFKK